jgi:DNA-binding transcriptional regulator GbsR (MarR family)
LEDCFSRCRVRPLPTGQTNAEEIADILLVARFNVSTGPNELQGWGLVKVTHVMGDRRDRTDYHVRSFA